MIRPLSMGRRRVARPVSSLLSIILLCSVAGLATAGDDPRAELQRLRQEVDTLRRRDEENRQRMAELERMLRVLMDGRTPAAAAGRASGTADDAAVASEASEPAAPAAAQALDRALAETGGLARPATAPQAAPLSAREPTVVDAPAPPGDVASAGVGTAARARLIDIALSTLVAGGGSSVGDHALEVLQGGAHDPNQNGFTLQQAELSLTGAVDPYFAGEAHIVASTHGVELEEAFLVTTGLPLGLQLEAGYSLTEFGLINPTHAHAWDWMDQPVAMTRMFGGEGQRAPGLRLGWLMPTPFFSELHVGIQNADEGEFTPSFIGEEGIGGRPHVKRDVDGLDDMLWLARWNTSWDLSQTSALLLGASTLYGPNATGPDGHTWIYGADAKVRWRAPDNFRGWPFFLWQTEIVRRHYHADPFLAGTDVGGDDGDGHGHGEEEEHEEPFPNDLHASTLRDTALYTQLLYGFRYGWAAGLRYEWAGGSGASIAEGMFADRGQDPLRDDRHRISPLLVWHPTEFSRLRLQYNYDRADHLQDGDAHTIWIGAEVLYGKHAAHKY
ncbi:MAG TPA: hypothetical protein VEC57_16490 [Candidatus Limnocylindrales bacterium]|nr:hypothetical protein [Candidatus Limnocylindrales bacterium]